MSSAHTLPSSIFRNPYKRPAGQDSVWDGDEDYGMLRLDPMEKNGVMSAATHTTTAITHDNDNNEANTGGAWPARKSFPPRLGISRQPTLEILKQQSVDQEISYLDSAHPRQPVSISSMDSKAVEPADFK